MTLTTAQINKAIKFKNDHIEHVQDLIFMDKTEAYPPTENYDKNRPEVWKPAHWLWFLRTYGKEMPDNANPYALIKNFTLNDKVIVTAGFYRGCGGVVKNVDSEGKYEVFVYFKGRNFLGRKKQFPGRFEWFDANSLELET